MELTDLPNISKVLSSQLKEIGIETAEQFKETGTEKVIVKLTSAGIDVCINKAYAIEGAIQGIRRHGLSKEDKSVVKEIVGKCK
jgi:DNA transformation protein